MVRTRNRIKAENACEQSAEDVDAIEPFASPEDSSISKRVSSTRSTTVMPGSQGDANECHKVDDAVKEVKSLSTRKRKKLFERSRVLSDDSIGEAIYLKEEEASMFQVAGEEADDNVEGDNKSDSQEETTRSGKKRRRSPKYPKGRGPEENRTCHHCGKVIVSIHGLRYHIDNFVCRKEARPEESRTAVPATKKRKQSVLGRPKQKESKRFRGSKEDRTCPKCKKNFTSLLGRDYHVKHAVCTEQSLNSLAGTVPFPTLQKGSRYITKYGVVEVITDDRATPNCKYPDDIKVAHKKFLSHRDKQVAQKRRLFLDFGFQSRVRRRRMRRLYELNHVQSSAVRNVYFGGSAAIVMDGKFVANGSNCRQDPMLPPEGFPDRIVACSLIPDERLKHFSCDQDLNLNEGSRATIAIETSITLYLRRQELNKAYNSESATFSCADCGTEYSSKEGFTYHRQSAVCSKKAHARAAQRDEMNQSIEVRVDRHLQRDTMRSIKRRKGEMAFYPQVWQSLGFDLPATALKAPMPKGDAIKIEKRVKDIDNTLNYLREEIRKTTDKKMGGMYNSVFKFLGFMKPQPPKVERMKQTRNSSSKRKCVDKVDEEADDEDGNEDGKSSPEIPILDIQVLIDEAKSGRYPSMLLYDGDHPDECVICKDGGNLFLCDFCCNAVHHECVLTKIIVKQPEPDDDFMCHVCAKKIVSRRNRAEKRRLQKQEAVLDKARQKALERTEAEGKDELRHESDYHSAAAVGKELSELLELLGNARNNLHHMVEASKINRLRRLQLGV